MNREEIFLILKNHQPDIEQHSVQSLAIFGSLARGDHDEQSDIDILVEFNRPIGLFQFVRLKLYLEELTRRPVDLVTMDALKPAQKERILSEMIYVR